MRILRNLSLSLLLLIPATGCGGVSASASKIYTSEGTAGYAVNCSGLKRNWGYCYIKAGEICKQRGYDVLEVTGEAGTETAVQSSKGVSTATTTTTHNRIMVVQCRLPEPPSTSPIPFFGD